ncbi:MAG TPA: hypothetical protein VFZ09_24615 [Archangium sp.]|uniref:hypothetical protein n=1 Tax=Archangium sp. TaxID=1872627 RepID=UPI002E32D1B4|nr:hypothetical protein [Archangium sp.]HEX5749435.1 hypothetical protein [Archangium sp.]
MLRSSWKTLMLTTGLAAQLGCGGPAEDSGSLEQPKGTALTGLNALQRLDMPPLTKGVDVTALVASEYHSLALAPTLQNSILSSDGSASSIIQTSDGGYAFTGTTHVLGTNDILLMKLDAFFNVQWAYAYGGSNAESGVEVRQTSDGGFMIAGQIFQNATTNYDFYLVRTDSAGNYYWQFPHGGSLHEYPRAMEVTPDGGCIIVGKTQSNLGYQDAYMVKYSATGAVQWTKPFSSGADGTYEFRGVTNVPGGGYVAVGSRQVKVSSTTWETYGYAVKVSSTGTTLFQVSSGRFAYLEAVAATSTGYVAVGYIYPASSTAGADFYAVRFNTTGGTLWAQSMNAGTRGDYLSDVQVASDGNYVITGSTTPSDTQSNMRVMKLDNSGVALWDFYPYPSTWYTFGQSLARTSDGGFIVSGGYTDPSTNTRYMLLSKFSP